MKDMDFIGKQIGNYHLVAAINSGAFGSVYRASHAYLAERTVAVKLLHAYLGSDKQREQFLQEAQFLEKLRHPYILTIHDVGFAEGFPYIISEYAPRGSLRELLKQQAEVEAKPPDLPPEKLEQGRYALQKAIESATRMLKSLDEAQQISSIDMN